MPQACAYRGQLDNYNYTSLRELPKYSFGTAKRVHKEESAWDVTNAIRDVGYDYRNLEFKKVGKVEVPAVIREGREFIQEVRNNLRE